MKIGILLLILSFSASAQYDFATEHKKRLDAQAERIAEQKHRRDTRIHHERTERAARQERYDKLQKDNQDTYRRLNDIANDKPYWRR